MQRAPQRTCEASVTLLAAHPPHLVTPSSTPQKTQAIHTRCSPTHRQALQAGRQANLAAAAVRGRCCQQGQPGHGKPRPHQRVDVLPVAGLREVGAGGSAPRHCSSTQATTAAAADQHEQDHASGRQTPRPPLPRPPTKGTWQTPRRHLVDKDNSPRGAASNDRYSSQHHRSDAGLPVVAMARPSHQATLTIAVAAMPTGLPTCAQQERQKDRQTGGSHHRPEAEQGRRGRLPGR